MYRTHNCGELNIKNLTAKVQLSGWVHKIRNKGFIIWVDLRDRYGSTQLIFDQDRTSESLINKAKTI
ncbi:MAG: OB-fold nucleic acid binding domain-containing protein, partial [Bacteroidota bacterium]|nr:OB-fold nucleic acid binding domain-containing protein [Bacteroidota bacterium]